MNLSARGQAKAAGNFMDKLQSQFGLNGSRAAGIAQDLIPREMDQLAQKTANPADN
jgi:hypothetical protein